MYLERCEAFELVAHLRERNGTKKVSWRLSSRTSGVIVNATAEPLSSMQVGPWT